MKERRNGSRRLGRPRLRRIRVGTHSARSSGGFPRANAIRVWLLGQTRSGFIRIGARSDSEQFVNQNKER